jgi:hypothetical protein
MYLMHATFFLKNNNTIVIRESFLVRNIVLNVLNNQLHGVIYASMLSGRDAAYSENEMFVGIAPRRELEA